MLNANALAIQRETFHYKWATDKVTGELTQIPYYHWVYRVRKAIGMSGLFTFISIVIVTYFFIFFIRYTQRRNGEKVCFGETKDDGTCYEYRCGSSTPGPECADEEDYVRTLNYYQQVLLGFLNGFQIIIYDKAFTSLSSHITDWENHKTQASFDNYIIFKLFAFKFVNSFISLFYLAYLQNNIENTGYTKDEIIRTLGIQLFMLFASSIFFQNLMELLGKQGRRNLIAWLFCRAEKKTSN